MIIYVFRLKGIFEPDEGKFSDDDNKSPPRRFPSSSSLPLSGRPPPSPPKTWWQKSRWSKRWWNIPLAPLADGFYDLSHSFIVSLKIKGWLAIAKLIPLSLFMSLLLMPNEAFDNVKIEK